MKLSATLAVDTQLPDTRMALRKPAQPTNTIVEKATLTGSKESSKTKENAADPIRKPGMQGPVHKPKIYGDGFVFDNEDDRIIEKADRRFEQAERTAEKEDPDDRKQIRMAKKKARFHEMRGLASEATLDQANVAVAASGQVEGANVVTKDGAGPSLNPTAAFRMLTPL